MQRSTAKRRIGNHAPIAAIVLNEEQKSSRRSRAGLLLVFFMRLVAALWIVEGLLQWSSMIAVSIDGRSPLTMSSPGEIGAMVSFATISLVAAVGLWFGTPWGGVIWLVSAGGQVLVLVAVPGFYLHPWIVGLSDVLLVSLYVALTWNVSASASRVPS